MELRGWATVRGRGQGGRPDIEGDRDAVSFPGKQGFHSKADPTSLNILHSAFFF